MFRLRTIIILLLAICSSLAMKAQISIVNIQLMPYNITPEALLAASVSNSGSAQNVQMVSKLYNFNNELLLTVKSSSFLLKQGLNSAFDGARTVTAVEYSSSNQAEYIKTSHSLSSGTYRVCIDLILSQTLETSDQFCDEIESDFNQYLDLVFPSDKECLETTTPLLVWTHGEPFSALTPGEYYRMVVSEIKDKQTPEEAVTVNSPLMVKDYLTAHSLQYPYDASPLQVGGHYAWQVQKMAGGIITNKTEAWEFSICHKPDEKEIKYVALLQKVDASYYTALNGRIYFKFTEEYNSKGNITAYIISDKGKEFPVIIAKDEKSTTSVATAKIKMTGDNRFVLDLDTQNIKPGFYTMQIKNEKKEIFYLKFNLPE